MYALAFCGTISCIVHICPHPHSFCGCSNAAMKTSKPTRTLCSTQGLYVTPCLRVYITEGVQGHIFAHNPSRARLYMDSKAVISNTSQRAPSVQAAAQREGAQGSQGVVVFFA